MAPPVPEVPRLAIDGQALGALRAQARRAPEAALEKAATQFEALFLQMLLKSMRESLPQDGLLDSEATRTYMGMLDQEFAAALSGRGKLGLADMLVKQLRAAAPPSSAPGTDAAEALPPANPFDPAKSYGAPEGSGIKESALTPKAREFIDRIAPHALAASRETGIPARFIVAQAALESGWGRREIRSADGSPSRNLFGIKAGRGWNGASVEAATSEYGAAGMVRTREKFRAYGSYAEAFRDYARLLRSSPRYGAALASGEDPFKFAQAMQQGGYATDPRYAEKIVRVIQKSFSARA